MRRAVQKTVNLLVAWLLSGLALVGVAFSGAFVLVSTDVGRGLLVPRLIETANRNLNGRFELDSFQLEPAGGIRLLGLRVFAPDGRPVLSAKQAVLVIDPSRLRSRTVTLRLEVDEPIVLLERKPDGALSLAQSFAPRHPSTEPSNGTFDWTIRVDWLAILNGTLSYTSTTETSPIEARSISLEGRGEYGRTNSWVELKVRGQVMTPIAAAAALDLQGSLSRGALRLSVLRASLGDSAVNAVAEGDLARRSGRVAVLGVKLSGAEARLFTSQELLTGELSAVAYAESDGRRATAAFDLRAGTARGGSARGAMATRLPPGELAAGFDLAFEGFDPSQLVAGLPSASINLSSRGWATGKTLEELRGAVTLSLKSSRLRQGKIGPGELMASASAGGLNVQRLALTLPGGALEGEGRYAPRGNSSGRLSAEFQDLAALEQNLEALLGKKLPAMAGRLRLSAELEGSHTAPLARLSLEVPNASFTDLTVRSLSLSGEIQGPRQAPQGRFEGSAGVMAVGGRELRRASLKASVLSHNVELAFSGILPDLGEEPVTVQGTGELSPDRVRLKISRLAVAFPGSYFAMERPAEVTLSGPSVDRLTLVSGSQRVELTGGIQGRSLDARLSADSLALGHLPGQSHSSNWQLDGSLSAEIQATGRMESTGTGRRIRDLVARAELRLDDGRFREVAGLSARASLEYFRERQHVQLQLDARRAAGGELQLSGELPVEPTRAVLETPVAATVSLHSWPLADLLRLATVGEPQEADGLASLEAKLTGTVGAPAITGAADLEGLAYGEWGPGTIHLDFQDVAKQAELEMAADLRGGRLLQAKLQQPADLTVLLRTPERFAHDLTAAPITASITIPGYDLSSAAGMADIPEEISGTIAGEAQLQGTWRTPRVQANLSLSQAAYRTYSGLGLQAEVRAGDEAVEVSSRGTLQSNEILRLSVKLGRPLEKLLADNGLRQAPLSAEAVLVETALEQAQPSFPLTGQVAGELKIGGTLGMPRLDLELKARRLALSAQPIGDLDGSAHYAAGRGNLHGILRAARGGRLTADLNLTADLGLASLEQGGFETSPAEVHLVADRLDLTSLPTVMPSLVHRIEGTLQADIRGRGTLARMKLLGALQLEAQRIAVVEFGEWTDVMVDASLDEDRLQVTKLEAHRGEGVVTAQLLGSGFSRKDGAEITGALTTRNLTITRAGQDLITIQNLQTNLQGRLEGDQFRGEAVIPAANIQLPGQSPRPLQSLEMRSDISIGTPKTKKTPGAEAPSSLRAVIHILVPNHFMVECESPRVKDMELKADLTLIMEPGELSMTGTVNTLRGRVEPIEGRVFNIERGRVQFTGGSPQDAVLDVSATYDNPKAKVQVVVSGPIKKPQIRMTSQPPLEESQIALLLATGRTELKANSGGVGTLSAEDASRAALGSLATQVFKDMVASKLPVDTAVEPGQIRAGVYISDQAYVGYTRRLDVQTEQQQRVNQNELRLEYQFSSRWSLELRYGDAGAGSVGLVWQKDY